MLFNLRVIVSAFFHVQEIQVEAGPQDGTLLVTWTPVIRPPSSGPVTGYAVYADGKKVCHSNGSGFIQLSVLMCELQVTDVDSPTGDHALIDIGKLVGLNPRAVTVRTKSRDAQSTDSAPSAIPSKRPVYSGVICVMCNRAFCVFSN